MTLAVLVVVTLITFFMLGFRFDINKGNLEQYAFLQFDSSPSGATVSIDGNVAGLNTPTKKSVHAGKHSVEIWRDGYETWRKSVDIKAGTITWLNYALLVPKKLTVEAVSSYESLYSSLASPKGDYMLIEKQSNLPVYNLVDISSNTVKQSSLTFPTNLYSEPLTIGINHTFNMIKWDDGGRYVLINHIYNDMSEWLVLDTQNVNLSKNITRLFDLSISAINFSGTSGNIFYSLDSNDIRKLDLAAGTISAPLISNVTSFDVYNESKVITYVGLNSNNINEKVVGIYREGDEKPSVIRTVEGQTSNLHIATTRYFNANYIAISEGKKVDILSGSYPNNTNSNTNNMKVISSFESAKDIDNLSFSPSGEYVFIQSSAYFASYDLEYQKFTSSNIGGNGPISLLSWLDDFYIWSDRDGKLTIREFDGENIYVINEVLTGQDVTLTSNGRYLYSLNKIDEKYQLQRVRMILP
jgi:hypothetical protein